MRRSDTEPCAGRVPGVPPEPVSDLYLNAQQLGDLNMKLGGGGGGRTLLGSAEGNPIIWGSI